MIKLNGKERPDCLNIDALLEEYGYDRKRVAVLVNGEIVRKNNWANFDLDPGDEVDVVAFVGGG
ncbi:MAG: sulfur carrier protein ThiS [Syntrophales bacterium]|jgi:thiamine biosynthesis protein ThiS|nr:sulfur carrier protein ThiS [Deltaproteobacteria bacterium]